MDEHTFLTRVREQLGPADPEHTWHAIEATLRALASACSRRVAERIARELPGSWGRVVASVEVHDQGLDLHAIAAQAAQDERVRIGIGLEHVGAVAAAVAECLDPETLRLVRVELAPDVARLLTPRGRSSAPPGPRHEHAERPRSTLSSGKAGTLDPIASAHHPVAHAASVDAPEEPHADDRLSGAHGTRQEQAGDTVASGHPRPRHDLDER